MSQTTGTDQAGGPPPEERTFTETAFEMAGKSAQEAKAVGVVDRADEQVEAMFDERFRTAASPIHRAVWGDSVPVTLFHSPTVEASTEVRSVMDRSIDVMRRRVADGTVYDDEDKISDGTFAELAEVGYFGLLVDKEYDGSGAPFAAFAPFLTEMATVEPTVAGLASVHQCIGAVDPVAAFGTDEQKKRILPVLARGERLSAFALTEPGAGSDLTALGTTARLDGDDYVVTGEKLFITNAVPGRTIGLVCLIDDRPAVLIADLPDEETDTFKLRRYRLHALSHAVNNGMVFDGFRVPAANLLEPDQGDGLTIAYHGLNKGRVALCANAAGTMRQMAASLIPWVHKRETYGEAISTRELVQRRLGRMAGLIVASDALVAWTSGLLDAGYRGEMECIVAKVFGSEANKEAAIELFMKTHGGRSFVEGHMFGDGLHDMLAPLIYEGEGEMLGMALFKSLVKEHGTEYFEPLGRAVQEAGITQIRPTDPKLMWAVRAPAFEYGKWLAGRTVRRIPSPELPAMPKRLAAYAEFASDFLQKSSLEISGAMRKHQLGLADRQARIAELTGRVIDATVILCTCLYAAGRDEVTQQAAEVVSDDLRRRLGGDRPSDGYFKAVTRLGAAVAEGEFAQVPAAPPGPIVLDY